MRLPVLIPGVGATTASRFILSGTLLSWGNSPLRPRSGVRSGRRPGTYLPGREGFVEGLGPGGGDS